MSHTDIMDKLVERFSVPKEDPKYNTPFEVDGFLTSSQGLRPVKMVVRDGIIYEVIKITKNGVYCDFDGDSYNQD